MCIVDDRHHVFERSAAGFCDFSPELLNALVGDAFLAAAGFRLSLRSSDTHLYAVSKLETSATYRSGLISTSQADDFFLILPIVWLRCPFGSD